MGGNHTTWVGSAVDRGSTSRAKALADDVGHGVQFVGSIHAGLLVTATAAASELGRRPSRRHRSLHGCAPETPFHFSEIETQHVTHISDDVGTGFGPRSFTRDPLQPRPQPLLTALTPFDATKATLDASRAALDKSGETAKKFFDGFEPTTSFAPFSPFPFANVPALFDPMRYARGFTNASYAVAHAATMPTEAWKAPLIAPMAFTVGFAPEVMIGAALGGGGAGPRFW